jgi:hypothetical protein
LFYHDYASSHQVSISPVYVSAVSRPVDAAQGADIINPEAAVQLIKTGIPLTAWLVIGRYIMPPFGNPPTPPKGTPAPELTEEEKQAAERKRLFELDLKKAQDDLKIDYADKFVRTR